MSTSCGMKACIQPHNTSKKKKKQQSRKEGLKEVLQVLQAMEHKRAYDPPGDTEIGYYLILRRYIRSFLTFFGPEVKPVFGDNYGCFGKIPDLHHLEELAEVRRHLASFSTSVAEMDMWNGYTPLTGINYRHEAPPVILGSRERDSAFYVHKFILAFFDLRSHTVPFFSPPSAKELICYLKVLDCTPPLLQPPPELIHWVNLDYMNEADVHSDYLRYLLIERMKVDTDELEMHCKSIIHIVLRRLSLSEPWDMFIQRYYDFSKNTVKETLIADLAEMTCKVCTKDLPAYILDLERSIRVAWQTFYFLQGRFDYSTVRIHHFLDENCCFEHAFRKDDVSFPWAFRKGWVALHALTLLNPGNRDEFGELSILNNPMIQDPSATAPATGRLKQDENVNNLQGIIEDFKCFGSSDVVPDEEETQLLHKIWHSVASSVEFFICSLAYEQRQCMIKGDSLSAATLDFMNSVRDHGLRTTVERKNDSISLCKLCHKMLNTAIDLKGLCKILQAYKQALLEKLAVASNGISDMDN